MFYNISYDLRKCIALFLVLSAALMFTACGQENKISGEDTSDNGYATAKESGMTVNGSGENKPADGAGSSTKQPSTSESTEGKAPKAEDDQMKKLFGENCISEQTFEVELSEYNGKVYFVPYAPFGDEEDFSVEIIQDGEVLTKIRAYVPDELADEKFSSLDAVSFYDVNYDGNTDIVLIETYGNTSFAAVYYGFGENSYDYEKYFALQEELSENISSQVGTLTIPKIRSFLADGKKNGEFGDY